MTPVAWLNLWNQFRLDRVRPRAEVHRQQVLASLGEGTPEEWCGSYRYSTGRGGGYELDLGPEGFYYEASCCLGTTELAYGKIASVDGARIELEILRHVITERSPPEEARQRFRLSDELYSVRWGEDRFLVPAELMIEFCSLAKAGGFDGMRYADYPCKVLPGKQVCSVCYPPILNGLPSVPTEFQRYLPD